MELREWQYINKPAGNSNTASASASSNTGFKKRLDKLIKYHGRHPAAEVEYILVGLLTKDKLEFAEHYDDGQVVEYKISIDPTTEDWEVKIFVNNQLNDTLSGTYWISLLKTLSPYLTIPVVSTPEYRDILHEWVVMNNKNSSSGYKKRFEKLIKYHIDHASSELESITKKDIKDDSFHLSEHYNTGKSEFDREIKVSYSIKNNTFIFSIRIDNILVENKTVDSYEKLVERLESYMFLPDEGTPEYDDLLTESLNEWQYINPPQPTASTQSQEDRYKSLLAQIDADGISTYTVNKLDSNTLDITLDTKKQKGLHITVVYNPITNDYSFTVGGITLPGCGYEEDILELLNIAGVIKNTDLCESASSIVNDFELYENLWD
jgi:hypothetical protein